MSPREWKIDKLVNVLATPTRFELSFIYVWLGIYSVVGTDATIHMSWGWPIALSDRRTVVHSSRSTGLNFPIPIVCICHFQTVPAKSQAADGQMD